LPESANEQGGSPKNQALQPMQLRMTIAASRVNELPEVVLPDEYTLRAYWAGDEQSWVRLLRLAGFTTWNLQRIDEFLEDPERGDGSRVVAKGGAIVSATFASRADWNDQQVGVLDFVASHPDHRRLGLSRAVCTAVLDFLVTAGYPEVILDTDDWRLPAIGMYLSLGFEPVMRREDMPARWKAVMEQLDAEK
jgi:mycothiol synthase